MGSATSSIRRNRRAQQHAEHQGPPSGPVGLVTNPHHPHIPPTYHTTPSASNQGRLPSVLYPHVPFPPPSAHHQQAEARPSNVHEATTVRNLVNLRKNSLKLSPRAGSPQILDISFMLDIVSECRVSIFLMAKEDSSTGAITAKTVVCDRALCSVGMNIKFPFAELTPGQSSIDTSNYSPEEINAAHVGKWQYPLIIRLETLADRSPVATTNTLAERAAGDALAPWVQSQTTYVVLGETKPDADDDSKIVRQRIYVHGQFYLLQEIYGITEANQAANNDDDYSAHCVVCLTNRKNTTVLPCRHFCLCDECAKLLLKRTRTCPMCRLPISSVLNIQIRQNGPP